MDVVRRSWDCACGVSCECVDFVDEVFAVFLRYVDKAMWERPANPGFLVGRKIFFVVVFLLF